jgi:hypothetical protein
MGSNHATHSKPAHMFRGSADPEGRRHSYIHSEAPSDKQIIDKESPANTPRF